MIHSTHAFGSKMKIESPNQSAAANRGPAGQLGGLGRFPRDPCHRNASAAAVAEGGC